MTLMTVATSTLNVKVVENKRGEPAKVTMTVISAAILTCKSFVTFRSACFPQVKRMIGGIGNILFSIYFQTENV